MYAHIKRLHENSPMKNYLSCFLLPIILLGCQKEKSTERIVGKFEKEVGKLKSWEYDVNYRVKYFSSDDDTLIYDAKVRLIRHETDTIFGGSVWIENGNIDRYYDLEHIYKINHNKRKITKYFPHQGQDWAINGNVISGVLNSYFLKPNQLSEYVKDSTTRVTFTDTNFRDSKRDALDFRFKDAMPFEKQRKTFFFNKGGELKSVIRSIKFQNQWQYNEWHFSNEKYNEVTDVDLRLAFENLKTEYEIESYEEPDPKEMEPLSSGQKAPYFTGFHFQLKDSIGLKKFSDKYILIDFWYKECYPCIKAIAWLSKLRDRYSKEDLVILGLNPYDNKLKDEEKLKEFIEINNMNYPTVFVDSNVTTVYNIRAFPTCYIIDPEGNILFSKVGFGDSVAKEVDSLLVQWIH